MSFARRNGLPREKTQHRVALDEYDVSRTKQKFKEECDINNILKKFQRTGAITHVQRHGARYGFASGVDFAEAARLVAEGVRQFEELPSSLRQEFETAENFMIWAEKATASEIAEKFGEAPLPVEDPLPGPDGSPGSRSASGAPSEGGSDAPPPPVPEPGTPRSGD